MFLGIFGFSANSFSAERTLWVFEQLASSPLATRKGDSRFQIGASAANLADSFSGQAMGTVDLSYVEISLFGAGRLFLNKTDQGPQVESQLSNRRSMLGAEIARYYVAANQRYGRLGFGYFHFFPGDVPWFRLALESGVLPTPSLPWSFHLRPTIFLTPTGRGGILSAGFEIDRAIDGFDKTPLQLGAFVDWNYSMKSESAIVTYEYMMLSMGPAVELSTSFGTFRLCARLRLWLDRENYIDVNGATQNGSPSEFKGIPDASLSWNLVF